MRESFVLLVPVLWACSGNTLPDPGSCEVPGAGGVPTPVAEPVALAGHAASFDDLRHSARLGRVMAVPRRSGTVYLVDPASLEVSALPGLPSGVASLDEGLGWLLLADRGGDSLLVVDPADGTVVATHALGESPDYVRFCAATSEVWVTEPGAERIAVMSLDEAGQLGAEAHFSVSNGPEGLAFDDGRRRAFAEAEGDLVAIDVDARKVVGRWSTGCDGSHGIPAVDPERGLVLAGCADGGGAAIMDADTGEALAGIELGGGAALMAVAPGLRHFYLRGDPGTAVAILGVCSDGGIGTLGTVRTAPDGHGMVADDRGALWVCDADTGGLQRVTDPYPAAP